MRKLAGWAMGVAMLGVAAISGACSSVDVEERPFYVSGARLRAKILDGGGGAVIFENWFDSKLELDCAAAPATDGSTRCLPKATATTAFLDASCATPALMVDRCVVAQHFVSVTSKASTACDEAPALEVYELGDPVQQPTVYTLDDAGHCNASPVGTQSLWQRGPLAAATQFVRLERHEEPLDGSLTRAFESSDDGAQRTIELLDTKKHAACLDYLWGYGGEYKDACIAGNTLLLTQSFHLYDDAGCSSDTNIVALPRPQPGCDAPLPDTVIDFAFGQNVCDLHYDVRAVGSEPTPPAELFTGTKDHCSPVPAPGPDDQLRSISTVIPPSDLPVRKSAFLGSGELRVAAVVDAAGAEVEPLEPFFRVPDGSANCFVERVGGELHCLTNAPDVRAVYADSACTSPLASTFADPGPCIVAPVTEVALVPDDQCDAAATDRKIVALGDVVHPAMIWTKSADGACNSTTPDPGLDYHAVGAEIDPSKYPRVTERVE
jgi:hypothetical protein